MNIKVCGITQLKQLQQLDGLEIAFVGLNFYKGSPRYAGDKISKEDIQSGDFDIKKVGVFVDASYDEIMEVIEDYTLDIVQLHGNEGPDFCNELSSEIEVIKVFRIGADPAMQVDKLIQRYDDACDYYLFDTAAANGAPALTKPEGLPGGTGKQFDWNIISGARIEKPFFLGGGIGPDDAAKVKAFKHPDFFAIDINSRFETSPGVKDMAKILKFIKDLK